MKQMVINYWWLRCPNNTRAMRYAEVLLLAAEASLQSGNASKAAGYVNKVRDRAQLPALGSVSMDDIKKREASGALDGRLPVTRI